MQKITADICPIGSMQPVDAELFTNWAWQQRENINLDPGVLAYPRTCMTHARMGEETVAMIPVQPVLMFESLVRKPELTARQTALALWKIGEVVESTAPFTGLREAYFITNCEAEANSCEKHGWIKVLHDAEKGQWLMKRRYKCEL